MHTPGWIGALGRLVPGPWGSIEQRDIGRAMVAEVSKNSALSGIARLDNQAMRRL